MEAKIGGMLVDDHKDDSEIDGLVARVETRLDAIEALPDPGARAAAEETVGALLDLYGEGLARLLEYVAGLGGEEAVRELARDRLVAYLLILHGLHPESVEARVAGALEEVRPYLRSHGGNVELVGIEDGVAKLRLRGSCDGCPSSAMTLKLAIEEAIAKVAPDLNGIEAEGVAAPAVSPVAFVPRSSIGAPGTGVGASGGRPQDGWSVVGVLPQLASGGLLVREVAGEPVLFVRLEGEYLAYQSRCPSCSGSLAESRLAGAELTCAGCGHVYDIRRAGRCLDAPQLHLEPIPLLVSEAGLVKIALRSKVG